MHDLNLILTLTGGLAAALVFGYAAHRIGTSPIVGYILAGIIVGPNTPGFVADQKLAEQFAEIGVILLMFGVGLQFHFSELLKVRRIAIPGAVAQSLVATALGTWVAHGAGWSWTAGIVFGLAISVASTVVLIRVLADNRALHTPTGHIAVGWLVVEDLFTVIVLVLLPVFFGRSDENSSLVAVLGMTGLKIIGFALTTIWLGGRLIPWLLDRVAATHSRELFTLAVLVLALGIAVGSAALFDVSMALAAFLAGMVVGRSEFSLRAASEALPMRDAFAVLFFVSVGMLFSPSLLLESPWLTAATLAIILVGKPLAALFIVIMLRYPFKVALSVAIALAQIGEFSFILATLGKSLGILTESAMNILVVSAIVSITINPSLYGLAKPVAAWVGRRPRLARGLDRPLARERMPEGTSELPARQSHESPHRAIIIGYGPVGRTVKRLLVENEIEPSVVEMNVATVRDLREQGIPAYYGDATQRDVLIGAGVEQAGSLFLTADTREGEAIIRLARELNPRLWILARSTYVREVPTLLKAGAGNVVSAEAEVALALTVELLLKLGATPEQVDRERARVHEEFFGQAILAERR